MKKYVKPDLYYENFELSHSVATNCSVGNLDVGTMTNSHSKDDCYFDLGGDRFFQSYACALDPEDYYEDYCYQHGSSANNFFAS